MLLVKKKLKHLALLILIAFSGVGCSTKEQNIEVTRVKASCKTPDVACDFRAESIDNILGKYLECIVDLKRANEVCK